MVPTSRHQYFLKKRMTTATWTERSVRPSERARSHCRGPTKTRGQPQRGVSANSLRCSGAIANCTGMSFLRAVHSCGRREYGLSLSNVEHARGIRTELAIHRSSQNKYQFSLAGRAAGILGAFPDAVVIYSSFLFGQLSVETILAKRPIAWPDDPVLVFSPFAALG